MSILLHRVADIALSDIASQPTVIDGAAAVGRFYDFEKHPYFVWIRNSTTRLEDFRASQVPYRHFVEQFSRGLSAVLSRISDVDQRLFTVYPNVAEEHGYGDGSRSHRSTFIGYLRAIGVEDGLLGEECPIRVAMAFEGLLGFCLTNPAAMGAAAMGIVEYTHIKIATMLAETVYDRFWGDLEIQRHYQLHAEIDVDHATSLFQLCEEDWGHPRLRSRIAYSLALGAHIWWSLFDAMCPAEIIAPSAKDGIRHLTEAGAGHAPRVDVFRARPRIACDLAVAVQVRGGQRMSGRASALNEFGMLLHLDEAPVFGAELELAIELPGQHNPLAALGRVRSRPVDARGKGVCIEFSSVSASAIVELAQSMGALGEAPSGETVPPVASGVRDLRCMAEVEELSAVG
jgi:pyrroloquinoline-quinone synthase